MTTTIFFSTSKFGDVTAAQVQSALDRQGLGALTGYEATGKGTGGQTMFIRSTQGEYVLKGNPLYEGQLEEEKNFFTEIRERTGLPVPDPYLIERDEELFGWPYAIMPRLPGSHLGELEERGDLDADGRIQIAELLTDTLLRMHEWRTGIAGEWNPASRGISRFKAPIGSGCPHSILAEGCGELFVVTREDWEWVEELLAASAAAFNAFEDPVFVMGDFKADNLLLLHDGERWRISGLFDFTTGYFGDGAADLPKLASMYSGRGERELAKRFILAYKDGLADKRQFDIRLQVHMLHQKVLDWGCAYAIGAVDWNREWTFRQWASAYVQILE